jgi:hypothetical protein
MGSLYFNDDDRSEPEDLFGGMIEGARLGLALARVLMIPVLVLLAGVGLLGQTLLGKKKDDDEDGK